MKLKKDELKKETFRPVAKDDIPEKLQIALNIARVEPRKTVRQFQKEGAGFGPIDSIVGFLAAAYKHIVCLHMTLNLQSASLDTN